MNPTFSVIVPVYNVEKYLQECINSILSQSITDFELLLIDDGSSDKSGIICDEYASKDKRIKVFHKENGGVSSARNMGLDYARGKWISFIDSDDTVTPDYLSFPKELEECDIIEKSQKAITQKGCHLREYRVKDKVFYTKNEIFNFYVNSRNNSASNKIIRRTTIKDKRLNTQIKIGEDFLFILDVLSNVKQYAQSTVGCYIQIDHSDSANNVIQHDIHKLRNIVKESAQQTIKICNTNNISKVGKNIVFSSYLMTMVAILPRSERAIIDIYANEIKWQDLIYLSLTKKIKNWIIINLYRYAGIRNIKHSIKLFIFNFIPHS